MQAFLILMLIAAVLLFPISVSAYIYLDWDTGKAGFALYLYGVIRVLAGYAKPYGKGIAFHITRKTALLMPYGEMVNARKKFEITKGFAVCRYRQVIEIGALEHTAAAIAGGMAVRKLTDLIFGMIGRRTDTWLEGDVLVDTTRGGFRASADAVIAFNLFVIAFAAAKMFLEKTVNYGNKRKRQKSR